jgi:hypothetical protein
MNEFDKVMAAIGVRPLDKSQPKKPQAKRGTPPLPKEPVSPAARSSTAEPGPMPAPPPPKSGAPNSEAAIKALMAEVEELKKENAQLRLTTERVPSLEAELNVQTDLLAKERKSNEQLRAELDQVDSHRRSLQRSLDQRGEGSSATPKPLSLVAALEKRGLRGETEFDMVLAAFAQARLGARLGRQLVGIDPIAFTEFLDEHLILHGACPGCPVPNGRAVVQVPRERCDLCGGSDIARSVRAFEDACMNHGKRRITIVGGSPRYHSQLRSLRVNKRLELRLVPGDSHGRSAQADLEWSDILIIWGGTILDHSTSLAYSQLPKAREKLLVVPHRGIARMLDQVSEHLRDT